MMSAVIAIVVLAGWAIVALVRPAWRPRHDLLLPIAAVFLVFCLASLDSQRPRLTQDAILQAGELVLMFLLLTRLATDAFFRPRLVRVVAGVTIIILSAYALQVLIAWGIWWSSLGQLSAPPLRPPPAALSVVSPWLAVLLGLLDLANVNLTAGICLLAGPFAAVVVWRRSTSLGVGVAAMGSFVLLASGSRGALVGAIVAGIVAGALAISVMVTGSDRGLGVRMRATPRSLIATAIAGLLLVGAFVALAPAFLQRFVGGIDEARVSLYRATLTLIAEHPILGTGPGTWPILHLGVTPEGARDIVQHHAHDTYLQTLSDSGIVGAIACLALALLVIRRLWTVFRTCDRADRAMVGAILVGLAGAAGHAISDNLVDLPTYCLILLALVAIGLGTRAHSAPEPSHSTGWAGHAVMALVVLAIVMPMPTILAHAGAEAQSALAREAADRGDWAQAEVFAREAVRADPGLTLYRIELGLAMAHLGRPEARTVLEQAAAEDPLPHLQLSVAMLALADGDPVAALDAALLAKSRSTGEAIIDLNLGEIAFNVGRRDLAVEAWGNAISMNVELAGSSFFSAPARRDLRNAAIQRADGLLAEADDQVSRALLLAYAGSPTEAEASLRAADASTARDLALARVLWLQGRQHDAVAVLEKAAEMDVLAADVVHDLVNYCDRLDDKTCLDRYRPRELLLPVGTQSSAPNDGSTIPAPADQRWRGVPPAYPRFVYLQAGFADMLVPDVLVIGTP
jgi:Lipid A core - O-antigen ligase and related enzymes